MAEYSRPSQQIWITKGHLAALAVATAAIAVLAFLVGREVGRSSLAGPPSDEPAVAAFLPDASDEEALEALLREVERAQAELAAREAGPPPNVNLELASETSPAPPEQATLSPVVSELAPTPGATPPAPAEPASADAPSGGWAVQIASYEDQAEADAHVARLVAQDLAAYRIAALVAGTTWHRVRIGGYSSKEDAAEGRDSLAATLGISDLMVAQAP